MCAAIVNHPAVLEILRVVNLLRVVFLVRGSFGWGRTQMGSDGFNQRIAKGAGKKVPRENCRKVSKNFLTLFDDF